MCCPVTMHVTVSQRGVSEIEVVYPPGQRHQAWHLCRQLFPKLENLELILTEGTVEPRPPRRDIY